MAPNGIDFRYPSYVQDILGPMCFDYGFGPFRWVCASGKPEDLDQTDKIGNASSSGNHGEFARRDPLDAGQHHLD